METPTLQLFRALQHVNMDLRSATFIILINNAIFAKRFIGLKILVTGLNFYALGQINP